MSNAPIPADLPANAIGFIARRVDRPERLALFRADGTLSNSFGQDDTMQTIAAALAAHGLRVLDGGAVVR